MIQLLRNLDASDRDIVIPVLENNCYSAHPESILLAAIGDTDEQNRRFATEKILAARHNPELATSDIRQLDKRAIVLNFMVNSYLDLID